jgi:mono/diheme cytochrome c family protein
MLTRCTPPALLAAALAAVTAGPTTRGQDPPAKDGPAAAALAPVDVQTWYTTSQGNEIYPYAFFLALNDLTTGKPFAENLGRFGLLDNPGGATKMPAGLTVEVTRDLRFLGVKMVGVTCAACHTGQLDQGGQPVLRTIGGPSLFDFTTYVGSLALNTKGTLENDGQLFAFLVRLLSQIDGPAAADAAGLGHTTPEFRRAVVAALGKQPGAAAGVDAELRGAIATLAAAQKGRPTPNLRSGPVTVAADAKVVLAGEAAQEAQAKKAAAPALTDDVRSGVRALRSRLLGDVRDKVGDAKRLLDALPASGHALSGATAKDVVGGLGDIADTIALLYARYQYLVTIASAHGDAGDGTKPLFGRLDAFGGARNVLFPESAAPTTAPVSYPHLWGVAQLSWYHWDGNDSSAIERNVGEAVATGAATVFTPGPFQYLSNVRVDNVEALEALVGRFDPPAWPAAFGPIDAAKAAKGKVIYEAKCLACHPAPPPPGQKTKDLLYPLSEIGTDPNRAVNFAVPLKNGTPFFKALGDVSQGIVNANGGTAPPGMHWRAPQQYAGRPLRAPWATAPFLHNGSVPTLYHLLKPVNERPKTFAVGHREYDPKQLGFVSEPPGGPLVVFDTSVSGNSNAGHAGPMYGTELGDDERWQLLEYLKTLR